MPRRDRGHSAHPFRRALLVLLVLVLLAGAGGWRYGYLDSWLGPDGGPQGDPLAVPPPPGLDLPEVAQPEPAALPLEGPSPLDPTAVRSAVRADLADRDLGRHVLATVAPLRAGPPVLDLGKGTAVPASTTKVVTAFAALFALGADHVFETTVVPSGDRTVVLVGGGDPLLARGPDDEESAYPDRADVVTLARRTARELRREGTRRVRVEYDDSLFSGPAVNPTWEPDYVPDGVVAPTTALWVDEGRPESGSGRVADPSLDAAEAFARALGDAGITVRGTPRPGQAPPLPPIAEVRSAPLGQIVQRVLEVSDNEASEVLLRHVGLAQEDTGSIEAGRRGVRRILAANGVELRGSVLHDGSGLSRENRLHPQVLVDVLRLATEPDRPDLRPVLTGLPVAGFTGSLADRMDLGPPEGRGRVRAKTGTLTGVTSLAGLATDLEGNAMVFVLMADRVPEDRDYFARVAMDAAAASLGACRCGG